MGGPFGRNGILIYVLTKHNAKVLKPNYHASVKTTYKIK